MSPLYNLTSVTMLPASCLTDVGVTGDTDIPSHLEGVSIYNSNNDWGSPTVVDGRTVRQSLDNHAGFLMNDPWSCKEY